MQCKRLECFKIVSVAIIVGIERWISKFQPVSNCPDINPPGRKVPTVFVLKSPPVQTYLLFSSYNRLRYKSTFCFRPKTASRKTERTPCVTSQAKIMYRPDFVPSRRMLYRPDVCNCTMPYVPRTVPSYAVRDPAYTAEVFALTLVQIDVAFCTKVPVSL